MGHSVQADSEVAFAVMQEATERLVEFMEPAAAVKCITAFGIMSAVILLGYEEAKELIMQATTEGLKAQLGTGGLGPS